LPPPPSPRISASNVSSTWGRKTWRARPLNVARMRNALARKSSASIPEAARLRMPSTKPWRDWVTNVRNNPLSSRLRPWRAHPYPTMVRDFSGGHRPARPASKSLPPKKRLPTHLFACRRRRFRISNRPLLQFPSRTARRENDRHRSRWAAALNLVNTPLASPRSKVFFWSAPPVFSRGLTPTSCKTKTARSPRRIPFSAGLDYPAIGPRARPGSPTSAAPSIPPFPIKPHSIAASLLSRTEGIIPALEFRPTPIAGLIERLPQLKKDDLVILNLSGPWRQGHGHLLPACSNLSFQTK